MTTAKTFKQVLDESGMSKEKFEIFKMFVKFLDEKEFINIWNGDRLSSLVTNKLLFFFCLASKDYERSNGHPQSIGMFQKFDNFWALPLGHVESDILDAINKNEISKDLISCVNLTNEFNGYINNVSLYLINKIPRIVKFSDYEVVELSHRYRSWLFTYRRNDNRRAFQINLSYLASEMLTDANYADL